MRVHLLTTMVLWSPKCRFVACFNGSLRACSGSHSIAAVISRCSAALNVEFNFRGKSCWEARRLVLLEPLSESVPPSVFFFFSFSDKSVSFARSMVVGRVREKNESGRKMERKREMLGEDWMKLCMQNVKTEFRDVRVSSVERGNLQTLCMWSWC